MDVNMRAIIFDLDNTIFDTEHCKPYLRTAIGREVIPDLILRNQIVVTEKFAGIISYINGLVSDGAHVFILSDSPKDYCEAVIEKSGLRISKDRIYGSQHKPCVENIDFFDFYDTILVVGDSAKDIYFAHMHCFSSVMLASMNEEDDNFYRHWTKPGEICSSVQELSNVVDDFFQDRFIFKKNDFSNLYKTLEPNSVDVINIESDRIGHAKEYWPNPDDWDDIESRKNVWFDIKRSIKVAKELTESEIKDGGQVLFYNRNGSVGTGKSFKSIMWTYFEFFKNWIIENNITGKVYLVPAPSSVPFECNRSFPMSILAEMWRKYAYHQKIEMKCQLVELYAVERYWPTRPAHMSNGKREVIPHFETLGIFKAVKPIRDASALIILDDVVTSGTQMSAVASLLIGSEIFPKDIPLYGFALAKTTRPGFDQAELLRIFSDAEKAGA